MGISIVCGNVGFTTRLDRYINIHDSLIQFMDEMKNASIMC